MPPTQTDTPKVRNPKGNKLMVRGGKSLNPAGRPAAGQGLKDRLAWWMHNKTVGEIERIINSPREWSNMVAIDAACARIVSEGAKSSGLPAVVFMFDRILGKAPQAITGEDGKPLVKEIDVNELARRTAFLLSLPRVAEQPTLEHLPIKKPDGQTDGG